MNSKIIIILTIISGFFIVSCTDDPAIPTISDFELGLENSKTAYIGSDLHVEANILAEGKINNIEVEIHQEENSTAWEFDTIYTKFSGLINPNFHEHIDIAEEAEAGTYHFHFIVTDMEGNQVEHEEELTLAVPTDETAPEVTVSSAPSNGESFNNGDVISISGTVTDDIKLGGIYIALVREGQELTDSEVNATNTIAILHNHDFEDPDVYDFSASITVGAEQDNDMTPKDITGDIAWQSGNYYILVKSKDAFGGNWAFSEHYPITINF